MDVRGEGKMRTVKVTGCARKDARRNAKLLVKLRRSAFSAHKSAESTIIDRCSSASSLIAKQKKKKRKKKKKKTNGTERTTTITGPSDTALRLIREEEREEKRYAHKLGYNKRKNKKTLPKIFVDEGLDYILALCDPLKRQKSLDHDSISTDNEQEEEEEEVDERGEEDEEEDGNGIEEEDIYGRLVNRRTGQLVSKSGEKRIVLPSRSTTEMEDSVEKRAVEKSLRGVFNRLNESTLITSIRTLNQLYSMHNRSCVKATLLDVVRRSLATPYRLPDRLLMEMGLFLALTHSVVSSDLSACFIEDFLRTLIVSALSGHVDDKSLENGIVLLAHMYNFKMIRSDLMIDVLRRLSHEKTLISITLVLLLLAHAAVALKKDSTSTLENFLKEFNEDMSMIDNSSEQMRFLLEKAKAVRKNNLLHLTDEMDSSLLDHYQKVYRSMLKAGDGKVQPLRMSLDDIEHAEERGRWWLIGSAFNPGISSREDREEKKKTEIVRGMGFDSRLVTLAERAQLKTEVRRSIFCTMLSAEDEMDAFERLLKLNLKGEQERQIIHIIIVTCTRENPYNPFYCSLLSKFCAFHRRFQLTSQFAFWDRLRELKSVSENRRNNLALLLADAIRLEAVGLSILKVVEFATLDNWTSDVMRRMLERLVMSTTERSLKEIFNRLIINSKHRLLCQGLQIFIDMRWKDEREQNVMLDKRLSLLETLLESVV